MKYIVRTIISSLLLSISVYSQEISTQVNNKIVYGDLAGNRDISFGVKNILDELVQDKGYDLSEDSESILVVDLLYFDVVRKSSTIGFATKTNNQVEIIAEARFAGKKVKVKSTADNIITSTIVLNNGGTFNQQSVSVALKKLCDQIIDKLRL
jgi:uncharacterized lipoprotein YajG